ncbi:MAG: hypothetical protein KDB22_22580 [Planctomycetales bacterium]|nr:hypothetical protein [Planctomycetales bacterium]
MKRIQLLAVLSAMFVLVPCSVAQEKKPAAMMDSMAVKKKMMEPGMMMAAEKAMMSEASMVPSMMAKEMMMHDMMTDMSNMSLVEKATPAEGISMMTDDAKMKMASEKMMSEKGELENLFQELVARHLVAQKMKMMAQSSPDKKSMMKPMMLDEKSMADGKMEMMKGDAMATMLTREMMIHALMNDPGIMAMVEKSAKMMQESSVSKLINDEAMMMKAEKMSKDPGMMKTMAKDAMTRQMAMPMMKDMKN